MTAHRSKPTITPDRVEWFARYHIANPAWGVFHVCLEDGNLKCGAGNFDAGQVERQREERAAWPLDLRESAEYFDSLTPSQRVRLGKKAEARAREIGTVK